MADDDVETARYQYDLLGRGTDYSDIHIYMFHFVSSRVSFSARPLSDVAASRVPSVAAAAGFLYSRSGRSRVWLRHSALVPKSGHDSSAPLEIALCALRRCDYAATSSSSSLDGGANSAENRLVHCSYATVTGISLVQTVQKTVMIPQCSSWGGRRARCATTAPGSRQYR